MSQHDAQILEELLAFMADCRITMVCPACNGRGTHCKTCPGGGEIPARQWADLRERALSAKSTKAGA